MKWQTASVYIYNEVTKPPSSQSNFNYFKRSGEREINAWQSLMQEETVHLPPADHQSNHSQLARPGEKNCDWRRGVGQKRSVSGSGGEFIKASGV